MKWTITARLPDVEITRGNYHRETYTLTDDVTGNAVTLEAYTDIRMDIRKGITRTSERYLNLSLGDGITVLSGGRLVIEIGPEDTDSLPGGTLWRDILFIDSEDRPQTLLTGRLEIRDNITV